MLQFAHGTLVFCEANEQNNVVLKVILRCLELALGLKINFPKSKLGNISDMS